MTLAELVKAEIAADAHRRAIAAIPEVLRPPDAVHEAWTRWENVHRALTEALLARTNLEAGS